MNTKEKIIEFMRMKQEIIEERFGELLKLEGLSNSYFTEKDARAILKWPKSEAERVWNYIKRHIEKGTEDLTQQTCPFCIKVRTYKAETYTEHLEKCFKCDYCKNRGNTSCLKMDSKFAKMCSVMEREGAEVFSPDFYSELIYRIEREEV